MNSTWPARSRLRSAASGSLTFTIISASREDLVGVGDDARRRPRVVLVVGSPAPRPAPRLDQHLMAVMDQLGTDDGRQADAIFVVLDLLGNADQHRESP